MAGIYIVCPHIKNLVSGTCFGHFHPFPYVILPFHIVIFALSMSFYMFTIHWNNPPPCIINQQTPLLPHRIWEPESHLMECINVYTIIIIVGTYFGKVFPFSPKTTKSHSIWAFECGFSMFNFHQWCGFCWLFQWVQS